MSFWLKQVKDLGVPSSSSSGANENKQPPTEKESKKRKRVPYAKEPERDLQIVPIQHQNSNDDSTRHIHLSEWLPKPPFCMCLATQREGGKTTVLCNLITRKEMYKDYFDDVYLWSPTCYQDENWKQCTSYITECFEEFNEEDYANVSLEQERRVEEMGKKAAPREWYIFDDNAVDKILQNGVNNQLLKDIVRGRHNKKSITLSTQSYHMYSRASRLNFTHLIVLRLNNADELDAICTDWRGELSKKQFYEIYRQAIEPDSQDTRPFLFIDTSQFDRTRRFRRNFDQILDWNRIDSVDSKWTTKLGNRASSEVDDNKSPMPSNKPEIQSSNQGLSQPSISPETRPNS